MLTQSTFVCGRAPTRRRLARDGECTVSAYRVPYEKELWYTGPVTQKANLSKPSVLYRIKVKLKPMYLDYYRQSERAQ